MSIVKVAKAAGVSVSTVSRVINRNANVSDDVTRKVKSAIKNIGYVPKSPEHRKGPKSARSSSCAFGRVAVLFPGNEIPLACNQTVKAIAAISKTLRQKSYQADFLVIDNSSPDFNENLYVGVIILGYNDAINRIEKKLNVPCVVLSSNNTNSGSDSVLAGNYEIGQLAADYLISEKKCTSVAFFDFNPAHSGLKARGKAFVFHAEELGASAQWINPGEHNEIPVPPENISQLEQLADLMVKAYLKVADAVEGIFIPLDKYTAFVYPKLMENGFIPNKNIFIISSDNEPSWLASLNPRPATIDINIDLISRQAAERVIQKISKGTNDDSPAMRISFAPSLVEGQSS